MVKKAIMFVDANNWYNNVKKWFKPGKIDINKISDLISGDADFIPAFELIKNVGKEVLSVSVPNGYSNELRQKFPYMVLGKKELINCLRNYEK